MFQIPRCSQIVIRNRKIHCANITLRASVLPSVYRCKYTAPQIYKTKCKHLLAFSPARKRSLVLCKHRSMQNFAKCIDCFLNHVRNKIIRAT